MYGYIYQILPSGLNQEPSHVIIKSTEIVNENYVRMYTAGKWHLLRDSQGRLALLFESKNNIWTGVLSKKSKKILTSRKLGHLQFVETIKSILASKIKPEHKYLRIAYSVSLSADIVNLQVINIDVLLENLAMQVFKTQLDYVNLHSTTQGFAIVLTPESKIYFTTLKYAVPASVINYFQSKTL